MFAQWGHHVAESLLHDEEVVPRTIGVAALANKVTPTRTSRASKTHDAETVPPAVDPQAGASFRSTVSNLVNTCLGSGMLSLPWVLARCGIGGGLLMMLFVPLLADLTLDFVVAAAALTGAHTLTTIAEQTIGRAGGLLSASTLLLLSFGVLVSYCVVIKQLTPRLARYALGLHDMPSEALCLLIVCVTCLVPLSSMESMAQLRFASVASIFLIVGFVLAVVAAALRVELDLSPVAKRMRAIDEASWWNYVDGSALDWLSALPIIAFSYLCHQNIPFMFAELAEPDLTRWTSKRSKFRAASRLSLAAATAIYVATAVGGFVAFGRSTQPNLLVNLQPGPEQPLPDALVPTLHAAFVGTMITTFPTLSFGLRTAIHTLCFPRAAATGAYRWAEASGLVAAVCACAIGADDLCFVFQIVGSICGSLLMFILPAAVYLGGPSAKSNSAGGALLGFQLTSPSSDSSPAAIAVAWAVLGVGTVIFFGSTAASVLSVK